MEKYPTLSKAPIVEAIADIEVAFAVGPDAARLDEVHRQIAEGFPNREQRGIIEFGFTAAQGTPPSFNARSGYAGLMLSSADKKQILQIGERGFTFSRLTPYSNGDDFRLEARNLWIEFTKITHPTLVRRLALRCINRIEIPLPFRDFDEYFRTFVTIPPSLPSGLAELLIRFVLPNPEKPDMAAVVTLQSVPLEQSATHVTVIFDIAVFQPVSLASDSEVVWEMLEAQRQYRNRIFFESLTPQALEMYI